MGILDDFKTGQTLLQKKSSQRGHGFNTLQLDEFRSNIRKLVRINFNLFQLV